MNGIPLWKGRSGRPFSMDGPAGLMGIVNLTPDSFYDGGRHNLTEDGIRFAQGLVADGADILDLGGESSRPGSSPVSAEEECTRILPVIDALKKQAPGTAISVDTYHARTARAALEHGADIINDISATAFDPELLEVIAAYRPGYVLMHCQGKPGTMQQAPHYENVVNEVAAFFERELNRLVRAGLPEENVILDPGIGFGKKAEHNLALINHPEAWAGLGRPSLMALSMKSLFGDVLGLATPERGEATRVATVLAFERGYAWHRVHDVAATKRALLLAGRIRTA